MSIRTVQLTNNKQMEPHKICENRILKTLLARVVPTILELTVWDSSLPASHFSTIFYECKKLETVRLWNCGKWLSEKRGWHNRSSSRIITSLVFMQLLAHISVTIFIIVPICLAESAPTAKAAYSGHWIASSHFHMQSNFFKTFSKGNYCGIKIETNNKTKEIYFPKLYSLWKIFN